MEEALIAEVGAPMVAVHEYTEKPDQANFHMHIHEEHELYCFLRGKVRIYVEGQLYAPKPGDVFFFKRGEVHNTIQQCPAPYERICVNFREDVLLESESLELGAFLNDRLSNGGKYYPAALRQGTNWLHYLTRMCEADTPQERRLYLTVMLTELSKNPQWCSEEGGARDNVTDVIEYIKQHLTESLDLDQICKKFFISRSHLNRKFKSMTNSTVWDYITTERLLLAKEMLHNGVSPTCVATQCGFEEYATFYRAFKKKYNCSPREGRRGF